MRYPASEKLETPAGVTGRVAKSSRGILKFARYFRFRNSMTERSVSTLEKSVVPTSIEANRPSSSWLKEDSYWKTSVQLYSWVPVSTPLCAAAIVMVFPEITLIDVGSVTNV